MIHLKSWGRIEAKEHRQAPIHWRQELGPLLNSDQEALLCYGLGRSYGDSCLPAEGGTALVMSGLNKLRSFDAESGLISAEAGLNLQELLDFIVPRGWFIPVSPGTKFVTLGGAIANDIHGKNHHKRGTFGRHILEFELMRSTGETVLCSASQNRDLFAATIGGLGLTGVISWCSLQLIPIQSALIEAEFIKTSGMDDFFNLEEESAEDWEYTVSWIDCMAKGRHRGRGIFIRGNHAKTGEPAREYAEQSHLKLSVPCEAPSSLLNPLSIRIFNELYYHKQQRRIVKDLTAIDPFFYPLDKVLHWNRLYGHRGMLQYQVLLGLQQKDELRRIFDL
ncbi:MAG: FAD-binding oxidoreductase, partial [Proteobacteria bacterium]|nr:FAD-binding oxidoreductase [Pseudomonadota bacterium]